MTVGEITDAFAPLDRSRVVYLPGPNGPERVAALVEIFLSNLTASGVTKEAGVCMLPMAALHQLPGALRVEGSKE